MTTGPLGADVLAHRDWLLSLLDAPAAGVVVDLGCGAGHDLLALAERRPRRDARFLGLDASARAIAAAAGAARQARDARVAFACADLGAGLPLADASVDAVYSHNLVECLPDAEAFAREVGRVLRPGGVAVIAHWDFDSQAFDASDRALARRLLHAFADWRQPWMAHADGWMGRRLWGALAPTGLFDGAVHARTLTNTAYASPWYGHARAQDLRSLVRHGLADADDVARFLADLEARARAGRYCYAITGYAFVGRRVGAGAGP